MNYAFYARQNTLLPAAVGVFSVGVYVVWHSHLLDRLGYLGLVWADTAKQASHALVMLCLLRWRIGPLNAHLFTALAQVGAGAVGMVLIIMLVPPAFLSRLYRLRAFWSALLTVLAGGRPESECMCSAAATHVPEMSLVMHYVGDRTGLTRRLP